MPVESPSSNQSPLRRTRCRHGERPTRVPASRKPEALATGEKIHRLLDFNVRRLHGIAVCGDSARMTVAASSPSVAWRSGMRMSTIARPRVVCAHERKQLRRRGALPRDGGADRQGWSVVDPALLQELVAARRVKDPLDVLSPREREVLALMAEVR